MKILAMLFSAFTFAGCASKTLSTESAFERTLKNPVPNAGMIDEARTPANTTSLAGVDFDGCYQMYEVGSMYPAFCLSGTHEEGINGSNVKLVIFGTNSSRVVACAKSSAMALTQDGLEYIVGKTKELILKEVVATANKRPASGLAVMGKTVLKFLFLKPELTQRLYKAAEAESRCEDVGVGEFLDLEK